MALITRMLGKRATFDLELASGRYVLDLGSKGERNICQCLRQLNCDEKAAGKHSGRKDTSQACPLPSLSMRNSENSTVCSIHCPLSLSEPDVVLELSRLGGWRNFRNCTLDGTAFEMRIRDSCSFSLPTSGILRFDYVSTTRPTTRSSVAMSGAEFDEFLKSLRSFSGATSSASTTTVVPVSAPLLERESGGDGSNGTSAAGLPVGPADRPRGLALLRSKAKTVADDTKVVDALRRKADPSNSHGHFVNLYSMHQPV